MIYKHWSKNVWFWSFTLPIFVYIQTEFGDLLSAKVEKYGPKKKNNQNLDTLHTLFFTQHSPE